MALIDIHDKIKRIFTLVELLIVIAIIAILASLLLPALRKAKNTAYKSVCANNQKQLYLGLVQYDDDFGRLPKLSEASFGATPRWWINGTSTLVWCGFGVLYPNNYVTVGQTFYCPSPKNQVWTPADRVGQQSYNGRPDGTYSWERGIANNERIMNNFWIRWNQTTNDCEATKMKDKLSLNSPNEWLSCDHWGCYVSAVGGYWMPHDNGLNVLFVDGHVDFCKVNLAQLQTWNMPYTVLPIITK